MRRFRTGLRIVLAAVLVAACATSSSASKGDRAMKEGRPAEAVSYYEKALAESPGDPTLIGKLTAAQEAMAEERTVAANAFLAAGRPTDAWRAFGSALEVQADYAPALEGRKKALDGIGAQVDGLLEAKRWREALTAIDGATEAGVPAQALEKRREIATSALARGACEDAKRWTEQGLTANALLAAMSAQAFTRGDCDADALVADLRGRLEREVGLSLSVDLGHGVNGTVVQPVREWAEASGTPLSIAEDGETAEMRVLGELTVETGRVEAHKELTLERQIGTKTVANPEYVKLQKQLEQLRSQIDNLAPQLISLQQEVDALYQYYLSTGSSAVLENLRVAIERLDDLKERYNALVENFNLSRERLSKMQQLLEEPVTEETKVTATDVRVDARALGKARLTAPWLEAAEEIPLDFTVGAQDYTWPAHPEKEIPAEPLELPDTDQLAERARLGAGEKILDAVRRALGVRAKGLVAEGDAAKAKGDETGAVERYVRALLLEPTAPRPEVREWIAGVRGATLPVAVAPSTAVKGPELLGAAEAPKTEAPKTEAPKTEAPKTEAPKTEAPKTEAPKTKAPKSRGEPTPDAPTQGP